MKHVLLKKTVKTGKSVIKYRINVYQSLAQKTTLTMCVDNTCAMMLRMQRSVVNALIHLNVMARVSVRLVCALGKNLLREAQFLELCLLSWSALDWLQFLSTVLQGKSKLQKNLMIWLAQLCSLKMKLYKNLSMIDTIFK